MRKTFAVLLCVLVHCLNISPVTAKINEIENTSSTQIQEELVRLQTQIQKIEKILYQNQQEEQALNQQLLFLDKEILQQAQLLRQYENTKIEHQKNLTTYQMQSQKLKAHHFAHQSALLKLVQATFYHQRKERLQLLFTPKDWSVLARLNQYYHAFYKARAKQVNTLKEHLQKSTALEQQIQQEQEKILIFSQEIKAKQNNLEEKKTQRQMILASLSKEVMESSHKLSTLQQQEQHLTELFKTLSKELPAISKDFSEHFAKMKKRLLFPIQEKNVKLTTLSPLTTTKKTYIQAKTGTPVNAIFPGRVVFAEWLRGIGLLIIIDHGHGYLSLYGNNQKLYKSLGEWVTQGEMIASVGQSGGHAEPGLYFEIRKDGEALDPIPWFQQA